MVEVLRDPSTHLGAHVDHVQTLISHICLVGEYAYEMKKVVRLPFVAFRHLPGRRAACPNKLLVTVRTPPDTFLDVVAVNDFDGVYSLWDYLVLLSSFWNECVVSRRRTCSIGPRRNAA